METFLYDWWPIRADAELADRLSAMPVRISYKQDGGADAWRWDWPAAPLAARGIRGHGIEQLQESAAQQNDGVLVGESEGVIAHGDFNS